MTRKNCWEVKKCGRHIGGEKSQELGVCPAAVPGKFNEINKGQCGGRFCWAIVGTMCGGIIQGTYAEKLKNCLYCEFFVEVSAEEGRNFVMKLDDAEKKIKKERPGLQ
ncbi:MAG: hypothetical protein HQM09_06440 [Candidatus Riflebacteria bacterium]|nr:hypothetical protein [Candidatus Riflebacteria bacterium]